MGLFRIPGQADKTPPPVDVNRVLRAPSADAIKAAEKTPVDADDTQAVARRLPADAERLLDPAFKTDAVSAQAEVDELPVAPDEPADPIEVSAGEADPSSPLENTSAINTKGAPNVSGSAMRSISWDGTWMAAKPGWGSPSSTRAISTSPITKAGPDLSAVATIGNPGWCALQVRLLTAASCTALS